MKRTLLLLSLGLVLLLSAGCLKEKVLEIVLTGETYADFSQDEESSSWTTPALIDVGREIREILDDSDYSTDDLTAAHITSASYGVTSFSQAHDWEISGAITVTYGGLTETIVNYTAQSIQGALGEKISAPLVPEGVDLINQALQDFLDGDNPVLMFTIDNGTTVPAPSAEDRMIFNWRAWLAVQVIVEESVEVPDPF